MNQNMDIRVISDLLSPEMRALMVEQKKLIAAMLDALDVLECL